MGVKSDYEKLADKIKKQGKANGHEATYKGEYMSDAYVCSCQWASPGYWDLAEAAYDDWLAHVAFSVFVKERGEKCGYTDPKALLIIKKAEGTQWHDRVFSFLEYDQQIYVGGEFKQYHHIFEEDLSDYKLLCKNCAT